MNNKKIISWIVPCFNEGKMILKTLQKIKVFIKPESKYIKNFFIV